LSLSPNETITNSGTLEATASGGLSVLSAVDNTGQLTASGGNVDIQGAVTGNGTATIGGSSTLEFDSASTAAVTFAANSTGTLQLGDALNNDFSCTVAGLTAQNTLDLRDITYNGADTVATFVPNASGGTLTVMQDITNVNSPKANIALIGNYLSSTFTTSSDGHGGTSVVDSAGARRRAAAGHAAARVIRAAHCPLGRHRPRMRTIQ
jgi:hypothetical protein